MCACCKNGNEEKRGYAERHEPIRYDPSPNPHAKMSDSSGDAEQFSDIDVEFDFLDPVDGDYHAIKRLLTQLFDTDSDNLPLGSIADLIIDQSRQVGSVIKNSEEQGAPNSNDPFAVISVINGKELYETVAKHRQAVDCLMDYVKKRLSRNEEMKRKAENSLDKGRLGLILLERFINMPPETTPPLLKMLSQELEWAKEDVRIINNLFV